jgi:hypothetical protein
MEVIMTGSAHSERAEWRGDLFRSDLGLLAPHLPHQHRIERPTPDTITVFYGEGDRWVDEQRPVRVRIYGRLPDLSPHAVVELLRHRLHGKLQVKTSADAGLVDHVEMDSRGEDFPRLPAELHMDGRVLTPHSMRVARRDHFSVGPLLGREASERERMTIDMERHLFRLAGRSEPTYLGDLGPRLEIKAPTQDDVDAIAAQLGVEALVRHLPYRSLELLFQDLLRDELTVAREGELPEMEGKLEVVDPADAQAASDALPDWVLSLPGARLLLPAPRRIVRLRRYHVCDHETDPRQWTIVETMAGRLSTKVKGGARAQDAVLVRDTEASHRTDVHGESLPLGQFVQEHDLSRVNGFDKLQSQVPFAVADGTAFIVKIDDCVDANGHRLVQCELEAIGTVGAPLDADRVAAHLEELVDSLSGFTLGVELRPTMAAKHEFFTGCACAVASD